MNIYDRIKQRRQELKLTQDELAEKIGYNSRSTIARIERGDVDLNQSRIVAFADALDCSVGWLLGGVEEPITDLSSNQKELLSIFGDLSEDKQLELLGMGRYLYYQQMLEERKNTMSKGG